MSWKLYHDYPGKMDKKKSDWMVSLVNKNITSCYISFQCGNQDAILDTFIACRNKIEPFFLTVDNTTDGPFSYWFLKFKKSRPSNCTYK